MKARRTAMAAAGAALLGSTAWLALPAQADNIVGGSTLEFRIPSKENQQGLAFANGRHYVSYDLGGGNGRVVEYDRNGRELKRSGRLPLGHATEMGYRKADGNFYVLSSKSGAGTRVAVVDMRPAKPRLVRQYNFSKLGTNGMLAIDNAKDQMVLSHGTRFTRVDMSGRVISTVTGKRSYLPQGIEVVGDRILFLASGPGHRFNELNVYSSSGTLQRTVRIKRAMESEGLAYDERTGALYAGMRWPNSLFRLDPAILGGRTPVKPQPSTNASTSVARDLLVNGAAENGAAARRFAPAVPVPSWRTTSGLTVLAYGAHPALPSASARSGKAYFAGGVSARSTASQRVRLTAAQRHIDAGRVRYAVSANLGGFRTQGDNARVQVTWLSASGASLGTVKLAPVTAAERGGKTGLLRRSASGTVPARAVTAQVTLIVTRVAGKNNDGYADNLRLVLRPAA